jgi:YGGT family.
MFAIFSIINFILSVLEIAFFVYWVLPIFRPQFKTHWLYGYMDKVFSPILAFLRQLIGKYLPARYLVMDWSYLAVILIIQLLKWIF